MKILADTKTVSIKDEVKLTSGALNSDTLEVELSKEYEELTTFVTFNETEIMVVGNMVDIPTLKSGTCRIGVYAIETVDDETVLRYSPSPATIFVSSGTYNENLHIDPPTQSEADRIYSLINKAIEEGKLKGNKGDKGDTGEQGPIGEKGEKGVSATINGKNSIEIEAGKNINIEETEKGISISAINKSTENWELIETINMSETNNFNRSEYNLRKMIVKIISKGDTKLPRVGVRFGSNMQNFYSYTANIYDRLIIEAEITPVWSYSRVLYGNTSQAFPIISNFEFPGNITGFSANNIYAKIEVWGVRA